jgi:hypothetical protein
VIKLGTDGYSLLGKEYTCENCLEKRMNDALRPSSQRLRPSKRRG